MKVLSLLQPWATLVVLGAKKYEVRSWQTDYRGPLLIHASAKIPTRRERAFFSQADYFKTFIEDTDYLPYGALIGRVEVTTIFETGWLLQHLELDPQAAWQQELAFDDYTPNRFAWKLEQPRKLKYILPVKGRLGLWEYNGLIEEDRYE
jgi:activating signal cointegrator 1